MSYASITKPSLHFNTKLFTGTGADNNAVTGVGFQPDILWIRQRNAMSHRLYDSIRGVNAALNVDNTAAENQYTQYGQLESFDSDGFTVGAGTSNGHGTNENGQNIVAWNWKTSGSTSSDSNGSITSTVSVNTTAGISIVSFTGTAANATVGHGLGAVPKVIITKSRVNAENWGFYHEYLGNTRQLTLNTTGAQTGQSSAYYNNTSPTSTVFSVGTADSTNDNQNMIAYCFAEKKGFSKFGNYTGNGNADGTFIYTGFKPAFFLMKEVTDTGTNWVMYDNKRSSSNVVNKYLFPNTGDAEGTGLEWDFLSNGVKCRTSNGGINGSTNAYIYMAFAEEPLVANVGGGIPATAR